jgi:hypothetical protein
MRRRPRPHLSGWRLAACAACTLATLLLLPAAAVLLAVRQAAAAVVLLAVALVVATIATWLLEMGARAVGPGSERQVGEPADVA